MCAMPDPVLAGYWPSPWPCEDGGPRRTQARADGGPGLGLMSADRLRVVSRMMPIACMTILRDPGEVYVQGHSGGPGGSTSWVERIDAESLATVKRSPELEGGPV